MTTEMVRAGNDGADERVVESLVLRGDISALGPRDRVRYYVTMCQQLGLNPSAQPFTFLKLNGKEILYAGRGCTDQLARIHGVTRELIEQPKVIDLAGTKIVYAVCRATLPGGRSETATATLPLSDPSMVLMKVETKAKRRATLAILGLALLDESEVADIPAGAKEGESRPSPKDISDAEAPEGSRAFAAFVLAVARLATVTALLDLYHGLVADLREEGHDPAEYLADGADPAALGAASLVSNRVTQLGHRLAKDELTMLLTDAGAKAAALLDSQAEALAGKHGPDFNVAAVEWWRSHRSEMHDDPMLARFVWDALARRWAGGDGPPDGPRTKRAKAELKRAVEIADTPVATEPTSASPAARKVREVLPGAEAEVRAHVGRYGHPRAIENAARKYAPMPALHRALAERLMAVTPADDDGTRLTERGALLQVEAWSQQEPVAAVRKAVGR